MKVCLIGCQDAKINEHLDGTVTNEPLQNQAVLSYNSLICRESIVFIARNHLSFMLQLRVMVIALDSE